MQGYYTRQAGFGKKKIVAFLRLSSLPLESSELVANRTFLVRISTNYTTNVFRGRNDFLASLTFIKWQTTIFRNFYLLPIAALRALNIRFCHNNLKLYDLWYRAEAST
jgi:hypothetical protein